MSALSHPFVLARVLAALAASLLLAAAVRTSVRVLLRWRVSTLNEGQITLERRAELVATIVQTALVIEMLGLVGTVLSADRLSHSIRGAMCAYGVFASTASGFSALGASAASFAACGLWLVLHRLDLRLATPVLTRRKFVALFVVAPIVWLDLIETVRFAMQLDLGVISSCCSTNLDRADAIFGADNPGAGRIWVGIAGAVAVATALGAALWARRRPGGAAAWTAALAAVVAPVAAVPAIVLVVAPYTYETPNHLCPFCLLHADVWGLGWPLFIALGVGTVLGAGIALVEAHRRRSGEPEQARALSRRLATGAAVCWLVVLVVGAKPIVRWMVVTGGAPLFGGP